VSGPPPGRLRVLVVGAGIAGLAAARTLTAAGVAVEVIDRAPGPDPNGAGLYLPANAGRALRALGRYDAVAARSATVSRQRYCDRSGRVLTEIDLTRLWGDVGACLAVHWRDVHGALLDGVPVTWGLAVTGLTVAEDIDDRYTAGVALSDGSTREVDLVLGADGVHSTVRRLAFPGVEARPVGQRGWRFLVPCPDGVTAWTAQVGRDSVWLTLPVGGGRAYCYADRSTATAPRGTVTVDTLRELFGAYGEPARTVLATLDPGTAIHAADIREVAMPRWRSGPVLLVGDAAHATSPNMAEGAAMALEDALVLAETLTQAGKLDAALSAYEERRRRRTGWVLAMTHRRDRLRSLPNGLRNTALRLVGGRLLAAHYAPLLAAP
jgi:2-polyprenyl-6-methoxyphenol hydroxylase-like FAD-dependent oxidoreductase